jgi:hypothetical protein
MDPPPAGFRTPTLQPRFSFFTDSYTTPSEFGSMLIPPEIDSLRSGGRRRRLCGRTYAKLLGDRRPRLRDRAHRGAEALAGAGTARP